MIRAKRLTATVYRILGLLFVGLGIAGIILPVMPGTIFLILAVACFSKSDPRLESWMLNHPQFGQTLRDWRETGAIRMRTKVIAILTILVCVGVSVSVISAFGVQLVVGVVALGVCVYIWTRPTRYSLLTSQR